MFDPTVGRLLEEDPEGFDAGDTNLYRYVGDNPTNFTDPSGLVVYSDRQLLEHYRIDLSSMTPASVNGKSFTASRGGWKITFKFNRAYVGTWPQAEVPGRILHGAVVDIKISTEGLKYDSLQELQVVRKFSVDKGGASWSSRKGDSPVRQERAGQRWWQGKQYSEGWAVDALEDSHDYFAPKHTYNMQTHETFDSPAVRSGETNCGLEFYTCAIGITNKKATFLGCIHWAFYNDPDNKVKWVWDTPDVSLDCPAVVGDAVRRWNSIKNNQFADIADLHYTPGSGFYGLDEELTPYLDQKNPLGGVPGY
jgi:hypothetical protein